MEDKKSGTHNRSDSAVKKWGEEVALSQQIFSTLIVMEESLRRQYIELSISRRRHVLFFSVLVLAAVYFSYGVFVSPSMYWVINIVDRLMAFTCYITLGLFYLTGLYHKAFVVAPRFILDANKGLRLFNVKLVRVPTTWRETIGRTVWSPVYSQQPENIVKLVLSTRAFSPDTIEAWEIYRQDYFDRERERALRRKTREHTKGSKSVSKKREKGTSAVPVAAS
jgi:hypothetical protein